MKKSLIIAKLFFEFIRCSPHLLLFFFHRNRDFISADVKRWMSILDLPYNKTIGFLYLLSFNPEFRNLFYLRVGYWRFLLNPICPQMSSLYVYTKKIGKGLFIQHGFATVIGAESIGENCWINQQVTIGYANKTDAPVLGDNVTVYAGAILFGKITIGSNSIIGANSMVAKDVPANCTVVGVPAHIIKINGVKFNGKHSVTSVNGSKTIKLPGLLN